MPTARIASVRAYPPCPLHHPPPPPRRPLPPPPPPPATVAAAAAAAATAAAAPRKRPGVPRRPPVPAANARHGTGAPPITPTLATLADDLLLALAAHLDLPALHALLRAASAAVRARLCALLPAALRRANPSPAARRDAAMRALRAAPPDPALAAFALFAPVHLAPAAFGHLPPDHDHPLLLAYAEHHTDGPPAEGRREPSGGDACVLRAADAAVAAEQQLPPQPHDPRQAVMAVLARAFLAAGGTRAAALAPHLLAKCSNPAIVLGMVQWAIARERGGGPSSRASPANPDKIAATDAVDAALQSLIVQLSYEKRPDLVARLLEVHPHLARARASRPGCLDCRENHGLLHAAAEQGCIDTVRSVFGVALATTEPVSPVGQPVDHVGGLLGLHDCNGESALSVAVRCRKSRVAQELMRCGADVEDLAGCVARGGGRLSASEVWFKQALDVD